jgi:hypothetical protein
MKTFTRYALIWLAAAAMLAGCGGILQTPMNAQISQQARSVAPDSARNDVLYVTGGCGGTCVFSYPRGRLVGNLDLSGVGLCSDKRGNVFMASATASGDAVVYEYAHGGTAPIQTLEVPGMLAEGCSVDRVTGNLAVTYLCRNCDYGPVAIFKNAKGTAKSYQVTGVFLAFCGHDNQGNLFADGANGSQFALEELPKGGNSLAPISVNQHITTAGQVQWDGSYLAIEDLANRAIYQFQIAGSTATKVGTTSLAGAGQASPSWIRGGTVIVPFGTGSNPPNEIGFWKYPAGGAAKKVIKKHLNATYLEGATVSVAPRR